jgi:hypothetical protein
MRFNDMFLVRAVQDALQHDAVFRLFDGPAPPSCDSPDPGRILAELELPTPPVVKNVDGGVEMGPWSGHGLPEAGTGRLCRSWRMCDNTDMVLVQGTTGAMEDPTADLKLQNPSIADGREIKISHFRWEIGGGD